MLLALVTLTPAASGSETFRLALEPAASQVAFELGATLHTVRGRFALLSGDLVLDEAAGTLSGRVVIDARSGDTGNGSRDANMHEQVLESELFPEIVLVPETLALSERNDASLRGTVAGRIEIHGDSHPVEFELEAERTSGDRGRVRGGFDVPYVAWGLRDLSTFVLRVEPVLRVTFEAEGALSSADARPPAPRAAPATP